MDGKQELRKMRNIVAFATVGKKGSQISSQAMTWGELQQDFSNNNIQFSGMRVVIGETSVTLESDEAQLPDTDLTIFLYPKKTKSGAGPARTAVQQILAESKSDAKKNSKATQHFNAGDNYTRKKEDELAKLVTSWIKKFPEDAKYYVADAPAPNAAAKPEKAKEIKPTAPKPLPAASSAASKAASEMKSSQATKAAAVTTDEGKIETAKGLLSGVSGVASENVQKAVGYLDAALDLIKNPHQPKHLDVDELAKKAAQLQNSFKNTNDFGSSGSSSSYASLEDDDY